MNSIRIFPYFISFFCWKEVNKKSPIKEDTRKIKNCKAIKEDMRKMENSKANNIPEKHFLQKLLEIGVSDHYARNIYIKVSLKIAGSYWHQKYFTKPLALANLFENIEAHVRRSLSFHFKTCPSHTRTPLTIFLIIKGAFVTFGKIYLCVKSHSFIFSLIPYCPLSFKTERTISLIFALVVGTHFAD